MARHHHEEHDGHHRHHEHEHEHEHRARGGHVSHHDREEEREEHEKEHRARGGHVGHHKHHHHAAGGPIEAPGHSEGTHMKHGGHAGHKGHHHGKKHRASGGRTDEWVSGNPDVKREAEEKKRGGRAKHHKRHRNTGGGVALGLMTGGAVRPRLDRPGRKVGGRVGADKSPLSSAHRSTGAAGDSAHGQPD